MSKRDLTTAGPFGGILARAMGSDRGAMSPAVARQVLKFGFSPTDQERIAELMERNQAGLLSPTEKAELDEFARVGTFLAILHAQGRIALRRPAKAKA
jgi:hypothetical protein